MSTKNLVVLGISVIGFMVLSVFIIVNLLRKNKRLENLLLAHGIEVLELEKEKIRTKTEEQRDTTQTARSAAEEKALQNEAKKKNTAEQATQTIASEIEREKKYTKLLGVRAQNTTAEIKERKEKIEAGINPDLVPPAPKTRFEKFSDGLQKHWFLAFVALIVLIIILHKSSII